MKVIEFSEPDADVVRICEELLEKAKSGEVLSVAVTAELKGGSQFTAWRQGTAVSVFTMLGGVSCLSFGINRNIERRNEDE